jgi:histidine ammonia-lyase
MEALVLNGQALTLAEIESVALMSRPVVLAEAALQRVARSRELI